MHRFPLDCHRRCPTFINDLTPPAPCLATALLVQIVRIDGVYLQAMHIWQLWDKAADAVAVKHRELVAAGWPEDTLIVVDAGCPFLAIM